LARGARGHLTVYDAQSGLSRQANLEISGEGTPQFSPDGRLLAIAGMGTSVTKLWETSTYREIATLTGMFKVPHSAAFSPDGTRLAVGAGGNESIVLWDVASHEAVLSLEGTGSIFLQPAFSPDESYIGAKNSGGPEGNGTLHLWRAPSWEEIAAAETAQSASARAP
jgi:WD40 repeat protein